MTGGDWFIGLSTLALAVVTALMALSTRKMASSSEDAIAVSREAVAASRDEATATVELAKEMRRDREVAIQPVVHVGPFGQGLTAEATFGRQAHLKNVGGGPTIGVRVFAWLDHSTNTWLRSPAFSLGSGESTGVFTDEMPPMPGLPERAWFDHGDKAFGPAHVVVFWSDLLGWRYRLPVIPFPTARPTSLDLRLPEPERRFPVPGELGWENDIRVFLPR